MKVLPMNSYSMQNRQNFGMLKTTDFNMVNKARAKIGSGAGICAQYIKGNWLIFTIQGNLDAATRVCYTKKFPLYVKEITESDFELTKEEFLNMLACG